MVGELPLGPPMGQPDPMSRTPNKGPIRKDLNTMSIFGRRSLPDCYESTLFPPFHQLSFHFTADILKILLNKS